MIRLTTAFVLITASAGAWAAGSGTNPTPASGLPSTAVDVVANVSTTNANPGLDIPQSSVDEPEYDPYADYSGGVVRGLLTLNKVDDGR